MPPRADEYMRPHRHLLVRWCNASNWKREASFSLSMVDISYSRFRYSDPSRHKWGSSEGHQPFGTLCFYFLESAWRDTSGMIKRTQIHGVAASTPKYGPPIPKSAALRATQRRPDEAAATIKLTQNVKADMFRTCCEAHMAVQRG